MAHALGPLARAVLTLAAATVAAGRPAPEEVLLDAGEIGTGWEVVDEAPQDPDLDPDLVRWGVRALRVRHYTRMRGDAAQVCSIEVWAFRDESRAASAHAHFAYPGWRFARAGELLIAVHGLTRTLTGTPVRGVFEACAEIHARIGARARGPLSP